MITKRTAFIIGAGAHVPYKMPTGKILREKIIGNIANAGYYENLGIPSYDINNFKNFSKCFKYSNINSIDKFLLLNPQYKLEGKISISHCIKDHETANYNYLINDEWIQFLYNIMIADIKDSNDYEIINENNIYFCTFNYDRMLDWCLLNSFANTFNRNDTIHNCFITQGFQGLEKYFRLKIDHVYGKIGSLDLIKINENNFENIYAMTQDLLLVEERKMNVDHILDNLDSAEQVFILGYGFNEENNQLLDLDRILKNKIVYATGYGNLEEELIPIVKRFNCNIEIVDSHVLLRKYLRAKA